MGAMLVCGYLGLWTTDFGILQGFYLYPGLHPRLVVPIQFSLHNRGGTHRTSYSVRFKKWLRIEFHKIEYLNTWILATELTIIFSNFIRFDGSSGKMRRATSFFHDAIQLWGKCANSKTPGRIFLGSNTHLLASWSEAFARVSAKFIRGRNCHYIWASRASWRVHSHHISLVQEDQKVQCLPQTCACLWQRSLSTFPGKALVPEFKTERAIRTDKSRPKKLNCSYSHVYSERTEWDLFSISSFIAYRSDNSKNYGLVSIGEFYRVETLSF
jgi:hypothetical protein